MELKKLKMQFPNISNYISKFEELCQNARYTQGAAKTANFFLSGLSGKVLADVFKPPFAQGYNDIKQKAIECTQSYILLDSIMGELRETSSNHNPEVQ